MHLVMYVPPEEQHRAGFNLICCEGQLAGSKRLHSPSSPI